MEANGLESTEVYAGKKLSPAEIGTAMHMVMQHVDVKAIVTEASLTQLLEDMVKKELLSSEQAEVIDIASILSFFQSPLGKRMQQAPKLVREIPFNIAYPASRVYADWQGEEEPVLVQGIIDVFFEDDLGTVLLDYKTDTISGRYKSGYEEAKPILESRYKVQIELYTEALEKILKRKIEEKYLFFFDGAHVLKL